MEKNLEYSTNNLEHCSYRYLQQIAKSMSLPSNVKKVHLIEMINAKKCSPESEVERIVKRVKMQRKHLTQAKKRSRKAVVQIDSSDNESPSPSISSTPKRPVVIHCSDMSMRQVIMRQNSLLRPAPNAASDRVLRSFSIKPIQRQYINQMLVETGTMDQGTQMSTMRIIRKYKPNILSNMQVNKERQVMATQMPSSHVVVKRPRLLSGIYPINKDMNFQVQSVGVRNREGKMSKINALIHKPRMEDKSNQTVSSNKMKKNLEITIQDIINGNLDAQVMQGLDYPNTSRVIDPQDPGDLPQCSIYYHKKIRSEQIRERRLPLPLPPLPPLPPIQDAFGQFRKDVTQPLYVQVDQDERVANYPPVPKLNSSLLETVYNFKTQFLTHQPLLQVVTTSNTKCVYSTATVTTATGQHTVETGSTSKTPSQSAYERDNQSQYNNMDSGMNDCFRLNEDFDFRCNEEAHTSSSSLDTSQSQELGANVTISDMVEDALELISQDGDYMERMGMDVRMQCVLCTWAGPKIILEYHIRKEHPNEIDNQEKRDWNITYTLGSLVAAPLWCCRVIQHDAALFVLSVKYRPDCLMATLSSLSTEPDVINGSITVFNKVTGEPHTWAGEIRELPPTLPYDTAPALTLPLRDMNLLPNSANVKLVNGELVLQSPSKVVFRQELNDIHVILFVKIFT